MPRYTLRALLIAITAFCCCGGLLRGCYLTLTHFEKAENVEHVDWLPQSASNVSYYRSYLFTAYEFDMPEAEFKRWTWLEVQPITEPVKVHRYSLINRNRSWNFGPNPSIEELEAWEAIGTATVTEDLYYSERRGNGGGVTVAYDRAKGRVYFQTNPR